MSAEIQDNEGSVTTTNFDTYSLILQLGCILNTVRTWKKAYKLRVLVFVEYETDVQEESDRVKSLLENLRIQAQVVVVWLAKGDLRTYEIIVNGAKPDSDGDARIEKLLGEETWWRELQDRRNGVAPPINISGSSGFNLGETSWPSGSFLQMGRTDMPPSRRLKLKKVKRGIKRHSISGLAMLGISVPLSMRTSRLNSDALDQGSSSEESSDDESIASSTASVNDISDDERVTFDFGRPRRASTGDGVWNPGPVKRPLPKSSRVETIASSEPGTARGTSEPESMFLNPAVSRLKVSSRPLTPSFSSKAIPNTQLSSEDGPGPSIMFASNVTRSAPKDTEHPTGMTQALSFNDLPSRGQHLILNELMRKYSKDTAVLFTTLPSPSSNSYRIEQDSVSYLEGLEVKSFWDVDTWMGGC